MSSEYNDNIAKAIDILLNKRLKSLGYDQTIIAIIQQVINSEQGKYKITYEGSVLEAEAINQNKLYDVGQLVYVKIPQSDFSNKLIIEGMVNDESQLKLTKEELQNYKITEYPIFEYEDVYALTAGPSNISKTSEENLQQIKTEYFQGFQNEQEIQFKQMAKNYEILKLEAKFSNALLGKHIKGNYGLKFEFLTSEIEENENLQTYILDTNNFYGNFYAYNSTGTTQFIYYKIPIGKLKALKSITFFQENMDQDENLNYPIIREGQILGYQKVFSNNLFASEIKVSFHSILDLSENISKLHLIAPQGYYGEELNFKAELLNKGKNIIEETRYSVFWYKRDLNSKEKNYAGEGWILQNEISNKELKLSKIDSIQLYKVIVLNQNSKIEDELEFQVFPNFEYSLPSIIQNVDNKEINLSFPTKYQVVWKIEDKEIYKGSTISLLWEQYENKIIKIEYEIELNDNLIGNSYLYLSRPEISEEEEEIDFIGDDVYTYDQNGDIYLEDAKREKNLQIQIKKNNEEQLEKCSIQIGNFEVTNNKEDWNSYEGTNSLLENVYYKIKDNEEIIVYYTINPKYNKEKINNTISCEIVGTEKNYSSEKEIKFSKIGDVNNTKNSYSLILTSNQSYFNVNFNDNYVIDIEIYNNGELLKDAQNYSISKILFNNELSIMNYLNNLVNYKQIIIPKKDINLEGNNYIELTIIIEDTQITSYFGIPIGEKNNLTIEEPPTKYVKYDSNGKNPVYQQSKNNPHIKNTFDYELANGKNYYFKTHTVNQIKYPIIYFLDTFGNQTINNWDGNILIDEKNNSVLANQIITGNKIKDKDNNYIFNGIVIGEKIEDKNKTKGIFGYNNNQNTFGLTESGNIYFGNNIVKLNIDKDVGFITGGFVKNNTLESNIDINLQGNEENESFIKISKENQEIFKITQNGIINLSSDNNIYFNNKKQTLLGIINGLNAKIEDLEGKIETLEGQIKELEEKIVV